jgi:GT2 family glycosyltransferase
MEIIVIDNASNDGTVEALRSEFPEAQVIESPNNVGYGAAVNTAIRCAKGNMFMFLNPDTEVTEGAIDELLRLASRPGIGVVGPRLLESDGASQPSARRFPSPWRLWFEVLRLHLLLSPPRRGRLLLGTYYNQDETGCVDWVSGACHVLSRSTWERVGELTERTFCGFDDLDYCMRAHDAGFENWLCADALVVHHCGVTVSERWTSSEVDTLAINNGYVILGGHWPRWRLKVYGAAEVFGTLSDIVLARRRRDDTQARAKYRSAGLARAVLLSKLLVGLARPEERCEPAASKDLLQSRA